MTKAFTTGGSGTQRPRNIRQTEYRYMGVQINICHSNYHVPGVCSHPGSKADLKKRTEHRRAKNKVARASRRANR